MSFPSLTFITDNSSYSYYRPAIASDGTTVIFEGTQIAGDAEDAVTTILYTVTDLESATIRPFLPPGQGAQTRADIHWPTGQVAFNGIDVCVCTVDADGAGLKKLPNTTKMNYPQWTADGTSLMVESEQGTDCPRPVNVMIDATTGDPIGAPLNGSLQGKSALKMFGGMPGLNPLSNPLQFAAAAQPHSNNWPKPPTPTSCNYNQFANQIYVNVPGASSPEMTVMEPGAKGDEFSAAFQGRAPNFSPGGDWVVFESNRNNNQYSLYLFNMVTKEPAVQVTGGSYGAQHAKFFPCGN